MSEQDPSPAASPASTPYRPRPDDAATTPAARRVPRGALAAAIVLAGGALLLPRFFARTQPTLDDVPLALLRTSSVFPGADAELRPATPLSPLLAADAPEHLAMIEPSDGAHRVSRGGSVFVRFNRPMVRAADVGRPLAQHPLRFTPNVRGAARWVTRSALQFDPEPATWNAQVETSLTLDEALRSLAGESLDETTPRTFVFAGGTQVDAAGENRRVLPGEALKLYFRGPVDVAALSSQMMVYEIGGGQRAVPFTLAAGAGGADERGRTLVNVSLGRELDPGSRVAVALMPSIYATWEGSETPGVISFELTPRPRFEGIDCPDGATEASSCEHQASPGRIIDVEETLRFWATNALATPLAAGAVTVVPAAPALRVIARDHELALSAEWEPGQVYEVRLGAIADAEGHTLGVPGPLAVRSAGRAPEVQTASGRLSFERSARVDLPFAAVHVDRGQVWYAAVAPGDELRAALLMPAVSASSRDLAWSAAAMQPLVPASRANHWGRGRYAWHDPAQGRSSAMALVSFDASAADEAPAPSPLFMQATDVGISATSLARGVLVWATSIRTAEPLADAEVTVADRDARVLASTRTDARGVAWIALADGALGGRHAVRVTRGDDRAVMVLDPAQGATPSTLGLAESGAPRAADAPVASVWTDRGAYRPGESMHTKAVVRRVDGDAAEAVRRGTVRVVLTGPDGDVSSKRIALNAFGSVDADFAVPASAMLGEYTVAVWFDPPPARPRGRARPAAPQSPVMIGSASVRVGEFRQPTVRVDLDLPTEALAQGDTIRAAVRGQYLFGAPTANTAARWTLLRDGAATYPVRWDPYTFSSVDAVSRAGTADQGEITLDADGAGAVTARVSLSASQREKATVEVVVRDASGQETSAWRSVTVYPGDYEVGVRKGPAWVERGASLDLDAVVIDHGGVPVAGRPVQARILREGWHTYWEWQEHGADDEAGDAGAWQARRDRDRQVMHTCALTSANEPARCAWTPDRPGTYVLEAVTTDARGRRSVASRRLYVAGPGEHPDRDPPGAPIQVTPSRANWFVGEQLRVAFECPWPEAEALVSVQREGVIHTERRRVQAGGVTVDLPVTREMVPNAFVTVTLVRPRTGPLRATGEFDLQSPDLRWGATEVGVRPQAAPLAVQLALGSAQVRPDVDVPIDVDVRDASGRGVASEVALYAVDEGSLRLTGYTTPDPTSGLLPRHGAQFALEDLRRQLVSRVDFPALPGASGDGGEDSERGLRDDREVFDPTPLWLPHLTTDANGHAHASLHVPSRNTQYRVMAVAVDTGMRSGGASATLTASRPVVLRPSFPRALTEGDRFEAAAFLHNAERTAVEATVTPIVDGVRRPSRTVHLDPAAEVRVAEALEARGEAVDVAFEVTAGGASDRTASRIPVSPRVRWSRAGAVGAVQRDRALTVDLPDGIDAQRGAVVLNLATHPFVGVDGAMEDLLDAPWGGAESHAAAALGWASLAALDVGLRPARWSSREVRRRAEETLTTLVSYQNASGGFGPWSVADETHPYLSAWALHALLAAGRAGFAVPDGARERATSYLSMAVNYGAFNDGSSGWNDELAFALRVLKDARRPNGQRVTGLYDARDSLTPFGLAQLAMAMDAGDTRRDTLLAAALRRTGVLNTTTFRDATGLRWYASSARTAGALLEAVSAASSDVRGARELAASLLRLRSGHDGASWGSSHESAYALAGLAAYARRFQEGRSLDATVLVDGRAVQPSVRTAQGARYVLPVRALGEAAHRVEVVAESPTFYAIDGRWATPLGAADGIARGRDVALHRVFETEAGAPIADHGHVRLGDLVRVRLFVYSEGNTAPFVVLRDPVGGGFEAVDQGFATTPQSSLNALLGGGPDDGAIDPRGFYAMRSLDQISHRAFQRGFTSFHFNTGASGLREYTYAVRATAVGSFTVAPAQLEAVYHPAQLARSTAATLTVDP
jgi:uncharacterized protein YfaS (alpha-2-macroglobulin family)